MIILSSSFIVLLTLVVISQAASVSRAIVPFVQNPTDLMTTALDYQNKINDLQNEMDLKIAGSLSAIGTTIKGSRTDSLVQLKKNSENIMTIYGETKEVLESKLPNDCVEDLLEIHERMTHVTGASFGNCLKAFSKRIAEEILAVKPQLGLYGENVNGIIHQSFNGKNAFKAPANIIEIFVKLFDETQQGWSDNQEKVEKIVESFQETADGLVSQFDECSTILENKYTESVKKITEAADEVCQDQEGIAKSAQHQFIGLMAQLE